MTDVTLLNTRALAQQQETYDAFIKAGFKVINFPCISIKAIDDIELVKQQFNNIDAGDTLIFTSQQAVHFAFKLNTQLNLQQQTLIAVGTKTAESLEQNTNCDIFVPKKQNSEGIIELLQGSKTINTIHLITAPNGRQYIQNFAQRNNIKLQQINVYKRTLPDVSQAALKEIEQSDLLYVLATSIAVINNLKQLISEELWEKIHTSYLVCASKRIADFAKQQGFKKCYNVNSAKPALMTEWLTKVIMK